MSVKEAIGRATQRSGKPIEPAPRWLAYAFVACSLVLIPWTVWLYNSLPSRTTADNWDVAWAGFDVFEATALAATFVALARGSALLSPLAAVAGTALLCDAWFDLITSGPGDDLRWSLARALLAELPLAALCFWVAFEVGEVVGATVGEEKASAPGPPPTGQPARRAEGRPRART